MNLAFSALVIILILVPGALFLDRFTKGRGRVPVSSQGLQDNIVPLILASILVHAATIFLFEQGSATLHRIFGYPLDTVIDIALPSIFELLAGFPQDNPDLVSSLFARTEQGTRFIFAYALEALFIALGFGNWLRRLVRWSRLDILLGLPPRQSSWYYLFNREQLARDVATESLNDGFFEALRKVNEAITNQPDGVYVDAVVEQAGTAYLYKGILVDFVAQGETLKTMLLTNVFRRSLADDKKEKNGGVTSHNDDERYYEITGDYFVLDYEDVVTINFDYFWIYVVDTKNLQGDEELKAELESLTNNRKHKADKEPKKPNKPK